MSTNFCTENKGAWVYGLLGLLGAVLIWGIVSASGGFHK
jgi:hypothetical protein